LYQIRTLRDFDSVKTGNLDGDLWKSGHAHNVKHSGKGKASLKSVG